MSETESQLDLHSKESRASMARLLMRLFELWQLSTAEQLSLLGLDTGSRTTLLRYRKGQPLADHRDLLDRIGHLMAIHKYLRILFPNNIDLAHRWMQQANRDLGNQTPVALVQQMGFPGLLLLRTYLEQQLTRP